MEHFEENPGLIDFDANIKNYTHKLKNHIVECIMGECMTEELIISIKPGDKMELIINVNI